MNVLNYAGYQVIVDESMIEFDGYDTIDRSWKERLFSTPWRPLQPTKQVARYKPMTDVIIHDGDKTMVMHPTTCAELQRQMLISARSRPTNLNIDNYGNPSYEYM